MFNLNPRKGGRHVLIPARIFEDLRRIRRRNSSGHNDAAIDPPDSLRLAGVGRAPRNHHHERDED